MIPIDQAYAKSLDGKWRFKLEQALTDVEGRRVNWEMIEPILTPESFEPFYLPDYREDDSWHDLDVPGNWELAGYSPATYNQPDNSSGFYRTWIDIPKEWQGRQVMVSFDGVMCGAEVWLNGKPVNVTEPSWGRSNYHESGWTAWQADLTPEVKYGEKNLLALRVTKNTKSFDLDSGDYFFLGGVYRPVTLFSVPQTHLHDITIQTFLSGKVRVTALVNGEGSVSVRLGDQTAEAAIINGRAEVCQIVSNPKLWSAEHPNLYPLTVELRDSEANIETVNRKIGIREVAVKDGVFMVNGVPVKITGMCRHDLDLTHGTAVGEDLWRKDLELMRAANINSVRCSHYPYGTGFYDLCDEMGFYVLDELPYCWCPTNDAALEPAFLQRARETVARDKNHACVVIWGIGNENKPGDNLQTVADLVKELDPTRPRLVSEKPADMYGVELDDKHYTKIENVQAAAADKERRAKWPILYSENPNIWDVRYAADFGALDLWAAVIDRTWQVTWDEDGIVGHHTWEWQDRAVMDKCPTKLYNYEPATGVQYLKAKGIVDGARNPRPEYYHMKMAHAPIRTDLKAEVKPGCAILNLSNHYSFTNLDQLNADWTLLSGGSKVASGTTRFSLRPRTRGKVELALPEGVSADALRIDFNHRDGLNVVSYQFQLTAPKTPKLPSMSLDLPDGLKFPQLNLIVNAASPWTTSWRPGRNTTGYLTNIKTAAGVIDDLHDQRLSDIRTMDAEIVVDRAPTPVIARVHAECAGGKFSYRVDWIGGKTDVQQLGWVFEMPHEFDHFSWSRQAYWSVYPETHIGRPTGTALPDSANVPLMITPRPDAHDFDSSKYHCDWAALTDGKGHGLKVEFEADQRHHVRGGFGRSNAYQLVVNKQCSPPRDISTNIVEDFYLMLDEGESIEGSFHVGSESNE